MGMLLIPIQMDLGSFFMLLMPMAAAVPSTVAIRADNRAMSRVLYRASIMAVLSNICPYHRRVKSPQWERDLELLKDNTIMTAMGA